MSTLQQLLVVLSDRWLPIATALVVVLAAVAVPSILQHVHVSAIPLVGTHIGGPEKRRQAFMTAAGDIYREGYRRFKDGVFRITTSSKSPVIVLSTSFLPELKKLPDDVISFTAAVMEIFECSYTKLKLDVPILSTVIKAQLTPALPKLNALIAEEVEQVIAMEMPQADDWTEVDMNTILMRIVAKVSGRIFVGPELCRDPNYLEAAINYTVEIMEGQRAVVAIRPWLRPFLASRLPAVRKLQSRIKQVEGLLQPIVERRRKAVQDPSFEKPNDFLQWLIDEQERKHSALSDMANAQLNLTFASIHTTTLTALNTFYDLAAYPDLATQLRGEIQEVLAESQGGFTSAALQSMKKLDSVLKETLRMHPPGLSSFNRKVLKTFTLSNGQVIPAGVIIEMPAVAINSDTDVFPNAGEFDGLRFYNLRQKAKEDGRVEAAATNQFVSISPNSLTFGYGRHACPGRFFAANEIKMIVGNALLNYEFRLAEGVTERYPNIEYAGASIPDPTKRLLCRRVRRD